MHSHRFAVQLAGNLNYTKVKNNFQVTKVSHSYSMKQQQLEYRLLRRLYDLLSPVE